MGARLAWSNLLTASGVTITSSSEATGYVDDALASSARYKVWRSGTSTGDQWVKFDLGSNQSMQVLAAVDATLHSGGTLRAQAHATDVWTSPTVNELLTVPATNHTGVLAAWLSASQSLRWVRFLFSNTGAVNSFVQLGVVYAGPYLEPVRSIATGWTMDLVDPSVSRVAMGGARSVVRRAPWTRITGRFPLQSATARDDLRAQFRTAGLAIPVLFTADPTTQGLTFYGRLEEVTLAHEAASGDLWHLPFVFTEDVA
jgi:hypothetical protein